MVTFKVNPSDKFREKVKKCQEYIGALDEERKKIQVFERELPLCLELVSQAIERCRQQMSKTITEPVNDQSMFDQYSDQTSSEFPILEEFIPMKSTSSTHEDIDDELSHKSKFKGSKDWLVSTQLSIQVPNPTIDQEDLFLKKLTMEEHKDRCDSFVQPLHKNKMAISSSTDTDGGGGGDNDGGSNDEDKGKCNKKERRCWSPELHRRFLHALQQLGGAHVATPKHIKELMKVNGLTTDEIKSHLQKYRLHIRRMNPTINNCDAHTPQLMVVGRIWMPPLNYTTNSTSYPLANDMINNAKVVYAPMASLPQSITASSYKTKQCN